MLHSYATIENAVILPYAEVGRGARLKNVIIDRGVRIPAGPGRGRRSRTRRQTISPHRAGHLSDHPADDRRAVSMTPMRVLVGRFGDLPSHQDRRPRRRGRRPADGLEGGRDRDAHPGAGLSRRAERAGTADEVLALPEFYGGPARVLARLRAPDSTCSCSTRRICLRVPEIPMSAPDGTDWPDNAIRFAALGRIAAEIGQGAIPAFVPRGRPRPRLAGRADARLSALQRAAAAGHGHDRSQPRLSRPISAGDAGRDRIAAGILHDRRRRILRRRSAF